MAMVIHRDGCEVEDRCGCEEEQDTRVREAVAQGNRVNILKTMRTVLGERLDGASARESASLSRQIQVLTDQITELEGTTNENKSDPLAQASTKWNDRLASTTDLY